MMMKRSLVAAAAAAALLLGLGKSAQAQDAQAQAGGSVSTSTPPVVTSTAGAGGGAAAAAPIKIDDNTPDHDRFIGHFAVGYFGVSQLPIAAGAPAAGGAGVAQANVNAPVVGVRYWLTRMIGIDGGIGLGLTSGSIENVAGGTTVTTDKPSAFGMVLHGGVPLAFAHGKHYTFLAVPEFNIGFTSGTIKGTGNPAPADQDLSGFRFDLGGRVGAEIHFGFIGIPELSLEGSIGLAFHRQAYKWKQDNNSASNGTTTFGTSVQSDPWALFVNNISAFYYF